MFYIINERNHIIAADTTLLSELNIEHIDDLTKQIILGDTQLNITSEESIEFITNDGTFAYTTQTSPLSSLLGDLQLVQLSIQEESALDVSNLVIGNDDTVITQPTNDIGIVADINDLILIKDNTSIDEVEENVTPAPSMELEELSLLDDTNATEQIKETDTNELFDLTIPNAPEISIDEISIDEVSLEENIEVEEKTIDFEEAVDTTPIIIYIDEVSENIGISSEDYNTFLNEYIDTSISLEGDLKNSDTKIRTAAITTLTQLADILELPIVNNIISKLPTSTPQEAETLVDSFYTTLSRLTTQKKSVTPSDVVMNEVKDTSSQVPLVDKMDVPKNENTKNNLEPINLEGVKPIHFDFQLEEAANDLSLPVELIEEFVHDFIEQAHIETEKMLEAYEEGDLDAVQKIGHMLKGASSNLRINTLSDTLYDIQFCEDISQMEGFIKRYWGHFLSFKQQIDALPN